MFASQAVKKNTLGRIVFALIGVAGFCLLFLATFEVFRDSPFFKFFLSALM